MLTYFAKFDFQSYVLYHYDKGHHKNYNTNLLIQKEALAINNNIYHNSSAS